MLSASANVPIPKRIYQCVARKDAIRPVYLENMKRLRAMNPGYELELFDDTDILSFLKAEYGNHYVDIFNSINPDYGAAKADFFRYLLIYRFGGIYLDVKSTADLPFDEVLRDDDGFILSHWVNDDPAGLFYKWGRHKELRHMPHGEYQQWHVIASPQHPYLGAVIDLMVKRIRTYAPWRAGYGKKAVMWTTGPLLYTQAIRPIKDRHPHRLVRDNTVLGLRYSIFEGRHDHRAATAHYDSSTQPMFRLTGARSVAARAYIRSHDELTRRVVLPLRRAAKALLWVASR